MWTWALTEGAPSAIRKGQLTAAGGRVLTVRLDGPADASFSLDGYHEEALMVEALATDLSIHRDSEHLFRGRIGPEQDDVGTVTHMAKFKAVDYRGMLARRFVGAAGLSFNAAQGAIAWGLVDHTQDATGGSWGITAGAGTATGTNRERSYDPGKPISEAIAELGRVSGGFDWTISPELELDVYHAGRGAANGRVLDYGGLISGFKRALDPTRYAGHVLLVGADGLTPSTATDAGIGTDPRGRWELFAGYPSIKEQDTLDARATSHLDTASELRPAFTATFALGRWEGPDHVWIGDTVEFRAASGRLAVAGDYRVTELAVVLDQNDRETVSVTLVPV